MLGAKASGKLSSLGRMLALAYDGGARQNRKLLRQDYLARFAPVDRKRGSQEAGN